MNKRAQEATDTHDDETSQASQPPPALAANVKRLRARKGFSPQQLADVAGLSVDVIHELERGGQAPTIKTLWSLATALSVPFRALIAPEVAPDEAARERSVSSVRSRRVLGSSDGGREVYELSLAPGATHVASARVPGSRENVLVTRGVATIETDGNPITLHTGESAWFDAAGERVYSSANAEDATLYVVLSQPVGAAHD